MLIAQKSFVFLVFLMPSVILIIFGVDTLPTTAAIVCICIGSVILAIYLVYTIYTKFCKSVSVVSNSRDLPIILDDLPPSYEGK